MFVEVGSRLGGTTNVIARSRITRVRTVLLEMLGCVGRRRGERNKMALKPAMCVSTKMRFDHQKRHSRAPA